MKNLILLLFLFVSLNALAGPKTIVVSDIDDTIKVAHIRSKIGMIRNAFRINNIFLGMSDLYRSIQDQNDAKIFYLTNAPQKLMTWSHSTLLFLGNFPQDENLLIRPSGVSTKVFKAQRLRQLMEEETPERVILIGDNGEHDVTFYHDIAQEYPSIKFHTFIRAVYNFDQDNRLYENQYSFVSPFEIANTLYEKGLLDEADVNYLLDDHLRGYLEEELNNKGRLYTPKWQKCYGHRVSSRSLLPDRLIRRIRSLCWY